MDGYNFLTTVFTYEEFLIIYFKYLIQNYNFIITEIN